MPFPAKAVVPSPVPVEVPRRVVTARMLGLGAGAFAVIACVALGVGLVAKPSHRAAAPVTALPAAPTTATVTLAPLAPPVAATVLDAASADEIAALMTRADQLVATGDIVAARGFYERAAEHGNAPAMTAAGKTYDPVFLEEMRVRGSRGDAGKAAEWYRRAGAAGDAEAAQRLKRLIARYAG
jgi:TPR repeat protein